MSGFTCASEKLVFYLRTPSPFSTEHFRRVHGHYSSHLEDRIFDRTDFMTEIIVVVLNIRRRTLRQLPSTRKERIWRGNSCVWDKATGNVIRQALCCFGWQQLPWRLLSAWQCSSVLTNRNETRAPAFTSETVSFFQHLHFILVIAWTTPKGKTRPRWILYASAAKLSHCNDFDYSEQ
jgi:hypothetical protein